MGYPLWRYDIRFIQPLEAVWVIPKMNEQKQHPVTTCTAHHKNQLLLLILFSWLHLNVMAIQLNLANYHDILCDETK